MSFSPSFLLVLLCLSMHACLARHFRFVKDVLYLQVAEGTMKENQESKIVNQSSGQVPVTVSWRVPSKNTKKHPGLHSDYSLPRMRNEIFNSSSIVVQLKATNIKGSRRRGQSLLRFDKIKANKNNVHEDAEVVDYDPPHRTPPIHNRKV